MAAAFNEHQQIDKGFGSAAGPSAPEALALAFRQHGYSVLEAQSAWVLDASEQTLIDMLADGFAGAVVEIGRVAPDAVADWLMVRRSGCVVGHTDTLALPL
jgi:hypothetical protein